jgi:hypothetical protein
MMISLNLCHSCFADLSSFTYVAVTNNTCLQYHNGASDVPIFATANIDDWAGFESYENPLDADQV